LGSPAIEKFMAPRKDGEPELLARSTKRNLEKHKKKLGVRKERIRWSSQRSSESARKDATLEASSDFLQTFDRTQPLSGWSMTKRWGGER